MKVVIDIGTDVDYARRVEYGFVGPDSLGRVYNQRAQPYLRPALDENEDAIVKEIGTVLKMQIMRAVA